MEPEPQRERSDEQWQHTAIDAARDRDWRRLRETVLPPGQPRMPDALLNARPEVRSMGVLHQLAFAGSDPGAEPTLRALVAAGCRFDPSVRSAATSADPAERSKTAPELARAQGFEALANLLAQLPDRARLDSPLSCGQLQTEGVATYRLCAAEHARDMRAALP